jgi:glycosyltransferase involved in cell wall biosynthesis
MTSTPLVSVLIPAYNSERWIGQTIESALGQTYPRTEIIVVDDGSTDKTSEIAGRYASKKVRVSTQPNGGAAAARNAAYALSQGRYIQWLDADDLLHPAKIEQQVRELSSAPGPRTLLSGGWAYFCYRINRAQFQPTPLWENLTPVEWLTRKMSMNLHMQTDNWLVSRELTEAAGPWDVNLWRDNDGEYFCRVLLASDGVRFVPAAKSYYRAANLSSVSQIGGSSRKLESLHRSMQLHVSYLLSLEHSPRTRKACVTYIGNWLPEFFPYRPDLAQSLRELAQELGGTCSEPRLTGKYQWIVRTFGWSAARVAQRCAQRARRSVSIQWDRLMYDLGR